MIYSLGCLPKITVNLYCVNGARRKNKMIHKQMVTISKPAKRSQHAKHKETHERSSPKAKPQKEPPQAAPLYYNIAYPFRQFRPRSRATIPVRHISRIPKGVSSSMNASILELSPVSSMHRASVA